MLSCSCAVAARPGVTASAAPKTNCVTRIAPSSRNGFAPENCFHPSVPLHRAGACLQPDIARSVRKWPHPQLLLADLPQAGKAARLDCQEEDDQGADHYQLDVHH